ncbi:tetratricopeptide repeat protein, partial [Candidatus Symbiopectobacterium sp. NZEC135]
ADSLAEQGKWREAAETYQQVYQPSADDIWLPYHYAQVLRQLNQNAQADDIMQRMAHTPPASPERAYAYALYLSATEREAQALAHLHTLPEAQWSDNMRELAQRLTMERTLAHAQALYDAGNEAGAVSYLQQQPADTRISLMLADWALQRGNAADALTRYRKVLAQDAQNADAQLGEVEALIAAGQRDEARQRLHALNIADDSSLNTQRRVANAWYAVGNVPLANQTLQAAKTSAQKAPPSQIKAWIHRDAARLETQQGQSAEAQADYRQAMVASGISSVSPQDNDGYTRLT